LAKKDKSADLLKQALERHQQASDFYSDEYQRGEDDTNFALGKNQWSDRNGKDISIERERDGRPCLVENRMLPFVNHLMNQIRQAKPSIKVLPVDDGSDPQVADIYRGIIRNIEYCSDAETAYDTAAYNAIAGGYGYVRIRTEYADYNSFDQEIKIERVLNPRAVMFDPAHTRLDGADAEYAFIVDDLEKQEFERLYPDAESSGFASSEWCSDNTVRVAEYFYKDYEEKTLVEYVVQTLAGGQTVQGYLEDVPEDAQVLRQRSTQVCTIKYAKMSGGDILEEGEFAGQYIPIVPVIGMETWLDGKRQVFSLIHQAKDSQRMLNYWKSAAVELIALQPKAPYVGAVGAFNSRVEDWESANNKNYPFLEYDPVAVTLKDGTSALAPMPQRQPAPQGSPAMMQEAMMAVDGIKASLGMYDAAMGMQTADQSGVAIMGRQGQADDTNYHFVDNLSTAIAQVGRILVGLIPLVYSNASILRIMGEDGTEKMMPVNQPVQKVGKDEYKPANGVSGEFFDLRNGKYDVVVDVGQSYATRRKENVASMMELGRLVPSFAQQNLDLIVQDLDMPRSQEMAERIRATMPPELLGEDLEAKRLQEATQAVQQLQGQLEQAQLALQTKEDDQKFKNKIDLGKLENDRAEIEIKAAKTEAEILKMQAETQKQIPAEAFNEIGTTVAQLREQTADMQEAFNMLLSTMEEDATGTPNMPVTQEKETDNDGIIASNGIDDA
jgi:hypothetical protein